MLIAVVGRIIGDINGLRVPQTRFPRRSGIMGLKSRRDHNEYLRANNIEPIPGIFAGIKGWARYLKRAGGPEIKIKNPERYLNRHGWAETSLSHGGVAEH
jgi:hypothetical protein